jgi:signal transduction histidine kinase
MNALSAEFRTFFLRRVLAALGAVSVGLVVTQGIVGNWRGMLAMAVLGASIFTVRLWLQSSTLSLTTAAHLLAGTFLAVAAVLSVVSGGGLPAPVLYSLPVIPLLVSFLLGWRPAAAWTAVSLALVGGLYLAADIIPAISFGRAVEPTMRLVAISAACITTLATAWAYELGVHAQQTALQKAGRDAEAANRAKSAFLAAMSHEIRTPLGGVVGLAELVHDPNLSEDSKEKLRLIRESSLGLLSLVDEILDFSRIEAGHLTLDKGPVDLGQLVSDVAALMRPRAQPGVKLRTEATGALRVIGDGLRLRQIALNLVGNALKFTHAGEVVVGVRGVLGPDGVDVELRVSDTGIGFDPSTRDRLFQAFVQAEEGTARRYGGSGLGLAITKRLVDAMDGKIEAQSEPGRGSSFFVRVQLPVAQEVPRNAPEPTPMVQDLDVLLVEDNAVNRRVFQAMLHKLGCRVTLAEDGAQGVQAASNHAFDVILMDLQMPVVDGLEATRRLRAGGLRTPIVALTANVTSEDRAACEAAGMDGFLPKPLPLGQLARALHRARRS